MRDRLGEIRVPTAVVHGTADPMFPLEHGRALAAAIPGATLRRARRLRPRDAAAPVLAGVIAAIARERRRVARGRVSAANVTAQAAASSR